MRETSMFSERLQQNISWQNSFVGEKKTQTQQFQMLQFILLLS